MALLLDWAADLGHAVWYGRGRAPPDTATYVDAASTVQRATRVMISTLPPPTRETLRCVCLSDTHEHAHTVDVPGGDVLLVAGDVLTLNRHFSKSYSVKKLKTLAEWFRRQPHRHKFFIAGNHDLALEALGSAAVREIFDGACEYLEDSGATFAVSSELDAPTFTVWGSPASQGSSKNAAFQSRYRERIQAIPKGTDLVVTHGPLSQSDTEALRAKLHVSGHVHGHYGVRRFGDTISVNASIMANGYAPTNVPVIVDIPVSIQQKPIQQ
eukprot:m.269075 g.269075  ORF g.269075 m.269075 type:complete len:269 (+) comp16064_c0_seq11:6683-7489(+)